MKKIFKIIFLLAVGALFIMKTFYDWQKIEEVFFEKTTSSVEFKLEKEKLENIKKEITKKEKIYKESLKKEIRNPFY